MIARLIAVGLWCAWQGTAPVGDGATDRPDRGYLGVMVQPLDTEAIGAMRTKPESAQRGAALQPGLLVAGLFKGGPAEAAGLAVDDVILSVAGTSADSGLNELYRAMRRAKAGEQVAIEYVRVDGQGQAKRLTAMVSAIDRAAMMKLTPPAVTTRPAIGRRARPTMFEDFESSAPGAAMNGWNARRFGSGAAAGWRVTEEAGAPSGKHILTIAEPGGAGTAWDVCVSDEPAFPEDCIAHVRLKSESGAGGGIVLGYQDARNFYAAVLEFRTKEVMLYKVVAGRATLLNKRDSNHAARVSVSIEPGKWHKLQAERQTTRLLVRVDGAEIANLDARDASFTGGKVGVLAPAGAATKFDDFWAEEPPKPFR